jgi:SAM-dependent methyltransferase
MAKVPYNLWADYITDLSHATGRPIRPGCRLLDLATGTGSLALAFAARGCYVTGIDRSEPMLVEARRKAAAEHLTVEFICRDLSDFQLPAVFDHAVCVYDSLNYILEPELLKRAFADTRAALKPGGLFIFDVNTVRALEAELFTQASLDPGPVRYRWVSRYHPASRICRVRMTFEIAATGEKFTIVHRQRAYTDAELRSFLDSAGFADITAYNAYTTQPPSPDSDRVFYVARVPLETQH